MRDDFLRGDWAASRTHLFNGIDKLVRRFARLIGESFEALRRQQFDAPWQHERRQVKIDCQC